MVSLVVAGFTGQALAATLVGDYQFQNTLGNTSGSAASLTEFSWYGASGTFGPDTVGTTQNRTVWNFPEGTGLVLNGANNFVGNTYSIVMLVKLNQISGWNKLVDFRHSSDTDSGLYVLDSNLDAYGCGASSTSNAVNSGEYQQLVMTRDTSKTIRLYVNGVEVGSGDDTSDGCSLGAGNQIHFLVDDSVSCAADNTDCEQTAGALARLRIYSGALTPSEVRALDTLPGQFPAPPEETVHTRAVSLTLKKRLIAVGKITVPDGFVECAQNQAVKIQKKTPSGFKNVTTTVSGATGSYRATLPNKSGVYRASVARVSAGGSEVCGADLSPTRRYTR